MNEIINNLFQSLIVKSFQLDSYLEIIKPHLQRAKFREICFGPDSVRSISSFLEGKHIPNLWVELDNLKTRDMSVMSYEALLIYILCSSPYIDFIRKIKAKTVHSNMKLLTKGSLILKEDFFSLIFVFRCIQISASFGRNRYRAEDMDR